MISERVVNFIFFPRVRAQATDLRVRGDHEGRWGSESGALDSRDRRASRQEMRVATHTARTSRQAQT